MRIRAIFKKTDHMRYTSHLDVHRTWERTLRRARLPLSYSQGFNPRPKINLAAALPLGFTSECEIIEFWLDGDHKLTLIEEQLRGASPPGIEITELMEVDHKAPKIPNLVDSARYELTFLDPVTDLDQKVASVLGAEKLPRERRGKPYDLRPLIEKMEITNSQHLEIQLATRSGATGRPEEVVRALGVDPLATRVHRTEIILKP